MNELDLSCCTHQELVDLNTFAEGPVQAAAVSELERRRENREWADIA